MQAARICCCLGLYCKAMRSFEPLTIMSRAAGLENVRFQKISIPPCPPTDGQWKFLGGGGAKE